MSRLTRSMPRSASLLLAFGLLVGASLAGCGSSGEADGDAAAKVAPWVSVQSSCSEEPRLAVDTKAEEPTALVVADICPGDGAEAAPGATVTAHYIGARLADGMAFDSSFERGEPIEFSLQQVIPGWQEGIPGMKVGGRRVLIIPTDLAYGAEGEVPEGYPAGPLVFVVDLVATR